MVCSNTILFPVPLGPERTICAVRFSLAASFIRSHTWTVSLRTSECGLRNRFHVWDVLKASTRRSLSMTWVGMLMTVPAQAGSARLVQSMGLRSSTGSALLLVSTMRLRQALRSPWAGRLPWTICFLNLAMTIFLPVRMCLPPARGEAVVEKECAVAATVAALGGAATMARVAGAELASEGLRRHLQQFWGVILMLGGGGWWLRSASLLPLPRNLRQNF